MDGLRNVIRMAEEHSRGLDVLLEAMRRDLQKIEDMDHRGQIPEHLAWTVLRIRASTLAVSEVMKDAEDLVLTIQMLETKAASGRTGPESAAPEVAKDGERRSETT